MTIKEMLTATEKAELKQKIYDAYDRSWYKKAIADAEYKAGLISEAAYKEEVEEANRVMGVCADALISLAKAGYFNTDATAP